MEIKAEKGMWMMIGAVVTVGIVCKSIVRIVEVTHDEKETK